MIPNILIVDDVAANLTALKALLKQLDTQINIITAQSGSEALEKVLEHEFALILTDVQMPEMDGFELASILRDHDEWNQIPIIFITAAYKDEQNRNRGYSSGAVDYIQKPIEEHILLSKVSIFLKLYEQKQIIQEINNDLERRVEERTSELMKTQAIAKIGGWRFNTQTMEEDFSNQAIEILSGDANKQTKDFPALSLFDLMSEDDRNCHKSKILHLPHEEDGHYEFEIEFKNMRNQHCHLYCVTEVNQNGGGAHLITGAIQDITERQRAKEIIQYLEHHDPLTGLPNRNSFQEQMLSYIADARAEGQRLAIMVADMDRFKDVNDTHGQAVADLYLMEIGKRLSEKLGTNEALYRVGGDEFAIIIRDVTDLNDVVACAENLLKALGDSYRYFDETITLSSSAGIAVFPQDADDVDSLMRCADLALHRSKETIGQAYNFYDSEMSQAFQKRKEQEIRLHQAIKDEQFELHYQPKINLKTKKICGVEALVRWNDPEIGMVRPDEFIPLAEETGQITKLGEWIIKEACQASARFEKSCNRIVPIAVNVSVEQIKLPELPDVIKGYMDRANVSAKHIELEITETSFLEDITVTGATLSKLRKMDLGIALDDFGTGYSSLTHLKNMLATSLKIDRSFIQNIMTDISDSHIADMIINVAHRLNMVVVAEGIEEIEQVDKLKELNCDVGQGYLFSRPLPEKQFLDWYEDYYKNL